jgi:hypothetical protein
MSAESSDLDFGRMPLPPGLTRASRPPLRLRHLVITLGVVLFCFLAIGGSWWFLTREPDRSIRRDPIEDDPAMQPILRAVEHEAQEEMKRLRENEGRAEEYQLGDSHAYWGIKKRIPREKYGIEWRTPRELNPHVAFD